MLRKAPCALLFLLVCLAQVQPALAQSGAQAPDSTEEIPPPPGEVAPAPPVPREEFLPRFDLTHLAKWGDQGVGMTDLEGQLKIRLPLFDGLPPVEIVPNAAVHFWDAPAPSLRPRVPDLPTQLYDLFVDFSWRPRPAEWLFIDLKFTPGLYTDFDNLGHESFRPRGHGLAIVALSERLQFIGGLLYTNRLRTRVVPAGGVRYAPSEDTEFRLVFPAPRISHRVLTIGATKYHAYLAGEFGGGTWGIRREDGSDDTLGYNDLRLLLGLEAVTACGPCWRAELGYVFSRSIEFASERPPHFNPPDTLLFRVGLSY